MDAVTYALCRGYVRKSLDGLGALRGKNCTIESIVHQDGVNKVTFKWTGDSGTVETRVMEVYDGTPIYVWEAGNTYKYGDIAIYESAFYRCIVENSDSTFDDTKWNEIGSPDGNYDIVRNKDFLPSRFTSADRKMYFAYEENCFYFWNGTTWEQKFKVDDELDDTSINPVQNKVITAAVNDIQAVINYNAANHNGIFRGKNLTNVYTVDEMYEMIHSGNFDDLYLGDYFTKSITTDIYTHFTGAEFESGTEYYEQGENYDPTNATWVLTEDATPDNSKIYATKLTKTENVTLMFAAFDYYYNRGDTALTTHHAVLIPKTFFATTAKMNPTNTTAGSYYNSDMHQITLPCYAKSLKTALGNHLLAHKTWLTTTVNTSTPSMAGAGITGASSASAWETTELQLMNEVQLYGTMVWSSSAYEVGVDNEKLPVFNFINPVQYGRNNVWFRSVVSSTDFAFCGNGGNANRYGASNALYVRPLILFG